MEPSLAPRKKLISSLIVWVILGVITLFGVMAITCAAFLLRRIAHSEKPATYEGRTTNEWKQRLDAKSDSEIEKAEEELVLGGQDAVPVLMSLLGDDDGYIRGCAAECLGRIGGEARRAEPMLIKALNEDRSASVRARAAEALGSIGADTKDAKRALENALNDDDNEVRESAANALKLIAKGEHAVEKGQG
jgi:hypothetical protein